MKKIRKLAAYVLEKYISLHYVPEPKCCYDYEADFECNSFIEPEQYIGAKPKYDILQAPCAFAAAPQEEASECIVFEEADEELPFAGSYSQADIDSIKLDKSFAEMLQYWINEKDLKPSEFYNAANIHRSSYSNIITHPDVVPKKNTALACVIGLKLPFEEAEDLLKRAGYSFSDSQLTDVIVRCYIEQGIYDIDEINEVLYERDLSLLGSSMN